MFKSLYYFSTMALVILIIPANLVSILLGVMAGIALTFYLIRKCSETNSKICRDHFFAFIVIYFFFICKFYNRWIYSSKLSFIAVAIGMDAHILLALATSLLVVASWPSFGGIMNGMFSVREKEYSISDYEAKVVFWQKIFLFIIAVVTITIFSKSSFLYPLNDWVDSNCFFTMGKSILYGKVPYRDLYEQKGPLLYFIHVLAALISPNSFLGVYFIEIIACYFFLLYAYKITLLYVVDKYVVFLMPFFSWLIYSSANFRDGDSAEELCLPFIVYSLFIGMKYLKTDVIPSFRECLFVGITSSCVLWIKYTMLGFYIGWIILPAILLIRGKRYKDLLKIVATIVFGVIIVTVPILLYFLCNHAIGDLFTVYFYNNMFLYNTKNATSNLVYNVFNNLNNVLMNNKFLKFSLAMGLIGLWNEKKSFMQFCITFAFSSIFIFFPSIVYPYYSFILYAFAIFGMITITFIVEKVIGNVKIPLILIVNMMVLILCVKNSSNNYLILENKDNLPQYKFKKIIEQTENPTLLNYGFLDGGFYTTCNIVPTCKYFCELNIQLDEMFETQDEYIEKGLVDFVVTRDKTITSAKYHQVSTASYYFEGEIRNYYLYQLK